VWSTVVGDHVGESKESMFSVSTTTVVAVEVGLVEEIVDGLVDGCWASGSLVCLSNDPTVSKKSSTFFMFVTAGTTGIPVGMSDGAPDGISDGAVVGLPDGMSDGAVVGLSDGNNDGNDDGSNDGVVLGTPDGCNDGTMLIDGSEDGIDEGSDDGVVLGTPDGCNDGIMLIDGSEDGIDEGSDDGFVLGTWDGSKDGIMLIDGSDDGIDEGSNDGIMLIDGSDDGIDDGIDDGLRVARNWLGLMKLSIACIMPLPAGKSVYRRSKNLGLSKAVFPAPDWNIGVPPVGSQIVLVHSPSNFVGT